MNDFYSNLFETAQRYFSNVVLNDRELERAIVFALDARSDSGGLSVEHAAVLLHAVSRPDDFTGRSAILCAARELRRAIFGNHVATMVPIEISSYCASDCAFCTWRKSNEEVPRFRLSEAAIDHQARQLAELEYSHFEVVAGDDLSFVRNELSEIVRRIRAIVTKRNPSARISICLTPLHEDNYRVLKEDGVDAVLTWQETYDPKCYRQHITAGPKASGLTARLRTKAEGDGFGFRLRSQEAAIHAGLQVGIGAMLGLHPRIEVDVLSTIVHGQHLINQFRKTAKPLIIGMPAWNCQTTQGPTDADPSAWSRSEIERNFELIAAIYLLSFPNRGAWIFPNCRVSPEVQINTIMTAGCFSSTSVRLVPGGYLTSGQLPRDQMYSRSSIPPQRVTSTTILKGEQFVHHYDSHTAYLARFQEAGLQTVSEHLFLQEVQ